MKDTVKFGCKECGSPHLREIDGKLHCITCGAVFERNVETDEERDARNLYISRLDAAETHLRLSPPRFDDAEAHFRDFIKHYPDHSNGYWGLVRARYGIKYEEDVSGKEIPSCYKSSYEDFREDSDFKRAIKLSENEKIRKGYKQMAELIAEECKEWRKECEKEKYDVFISFKATEDNGVTPTPDKDELMSLYTYLLTRGYKVFFSPMSMINKAGKHYDPYILNALQSAKMMIVYGSKPEYFTATWVENEWTRYLKMMSDGKKQKGSCIVAFKGFNANELPVGLRKLQAMDAGNKEFYLELVERIDEILKKGEKAKNGDSHNPESSKKSEQAKKEIESKREELRRLKEKNELDKQIEEQQRLSRENEERLQKEKELADKKRHQAEQKQKLINNSQNVKYELQNGLKKVKTFIIRNKKAVIISAVSIVALIALLLLLNGLGKNNNGDGGIGGGGNGDGYYEEEDDGSCSHTFGDWIVIKDATEDAAGEMMRVCSKCGFEDKEAIPKNDHVHVFGDWSIVTEATEDSTGERMRVCSKCGFEDIETIPELGHTHDIEILPGVEATCTSMGKTEGSYCITCDTVLVPQEIILMDHKFVDGECKYCHVTGKPSVGLAMTQYDDGYIVTGMGSCLDEKVIIPMTKNGMPVAAINDEAFNNNDKITEIVIPASVEEIPDKAFEGCGKLKRVTINGTLYKIGEMAFWQCTALEEVIINGSVEIIGGGAFYNCESLIEINLPAGIKSIDGSVEYEYDNYGAFEECTNLTKVTVGDESASVKFSIGDRAFYGCSALSDVTLGNGVTDISSFAFMYTGVKTVTLGDSLKSIAGGAFYGCSELLEITIPKNVEAIYDRSYISTGHSTGDYYGAFGKCESLEKVTFNSDYITIGTMAFWKCTSLEEVIFNGVVESIGGGAFYGCTSLAELNIPEGIKSVDGSVEYDYDDYGVFEGCTGLTKVTIGGEGSDVEFTIGDRAFYGCSSLSDVTLGNGVTEISSFAFMYSGIKTITLGESLKTISGGAFYGCSELLEITIPEKLEAIYDRSYISTGYSTGYYYGAFGKCESLKKVTFNSDKITIGTMAFWKCTSLEEVIFNGVVESIGGGAFYGCTSLMELNIPEGIKSIDGSVEYDYDDYGVFEGCTGLAKVTIGGEGSKIKFTIGDRAFYGCSALSEVTLGNGVTDISSFAFMYTGVETVTLGDSLESIAGGAFYGCRDLIEITIPKNVKAIYDRSYISTGHSTGDYYGAFGKCESLKKVTFNSDKITIGTMAFWKCTSLEEVIFNGVVESIGGGAFYGCTKLKEISIPEGIKSIDGYVEYDYKNYGVFEGCTGLTKVTIGGEGSDVEFTIGDRAFFGCSALSDLTLGKGVTEIWADAFSSCASLSYISYLGTEAEWNNVYKNDEWCRDTNILEVYFKE